MKNKLKLFKDINEAKNSYLVVGTPVLIREYKDGLPRFGVTIEQPCIGHEDLIQCRNNICIECSGDGDYSTREMDKLAKAVKEVQEQLANCLPLTGGILTGQIAVPEILLTSTQLDQANAVVRKDYVDSRLNRGEF